jgi:hypothetical protein
MDWSGEWWVLILGPGLVILVVGILYFTRSRAFRFRSAAAQLGLIALQGLNPITEQDKNKSNLFSRAPGGKISNLFGDRVKNPSRLVFDFFDAAGSPAGADRKQTVAAFAAADGVPDFQLIPTSSTNAVPPSSGLQNIRLDSDFGRRYSLRAENESAVRILFSDVLVDRLSAAASGAEWSVEKAGAWLLVYRHNVLFPPVSIAESFQGARTVASVFLEVR